MSETKTHWKKLVNLDYIGAYSIDEGKDLVVTITAVTKEVVKGAKGKEDECIVATLKDEKPFIINRTNCKSISKVHGSPCIEDWIGKKIALYATTTNLKGDQVECIRVREVPPQLPFLTPDHPRWKGAVQALDEDTTSIEKIEKNFSITPEHRDLLTGKKTGNV